VADEKLIRDERTDEEHQRVGRERIVLRVERAKTECRHRGAIDAARRFKPNVRHNPKTVTAAAALLSAA
jgi:hypothetical protein